MQSSLRLTRLQHHLHQHQHHHQHQYHYHLRQRQNYQHHNQHKYFTLSHSWFTIYRQKSAKKNKFRTCPQATHQKSTQQTHIRDDCVKANININIIIIFDNVKIINITINSINWTHIVMIILLNNNDNNNDNHNDNDNVVLIIIDGWFSHSAINHNFIIILPPIFVTFPPLLTLHLHFHLHLHLHRLHHSSQSSIAPLQVLFTLGSNHHTSHLSPISSPNNVHHHHHHQQQQHQHLLFSANHIKHWVMAAVEKKGGKGSMY